MLVQNPQDWSHTKKIFVTLEICLLTTSTYMAASLWSSSVDGAVETLGVSEIVANLGMHLLRSS